MPRKPTSPERKKRQLTLMRSELERTIKTNADRRSVLEQFVSGKSIESIAAEEHVSPLTVKKRLKELVQTYHDNFTTDVGFWMEILMARYNGLLKVLWPLATGPNPEAQAIKFVIDILEAQMTLVGASAVDRQRQQSLEALQNKADGELTISVETRYQQFLNIMNPGAEHVAAQLPEGEEITIYPEGEGGGQTTLEAQTALYNEDDAI